MRHKEAILLEHSLYEHLYQRYALALFAYAYRNTSSREIGLSNTGDVQIWSIATGQRTATFTGGNTRLQSMRGLAWSPDGNYLAESDTAIHLWDTHSQKIIATFGQVSNTGWISTLAWSPDSHRLAAWTTSITGKSGQDSVNIWKLF